MVIIPINTFTPLNQKTGENLLINGNFTVWQRGVTVADANARNHYFDLSDRWSRTLVLDGMTPPVTFVQKQSSFYGGAWPLDGSQYMYELDTDGPGATWGTDTHLFLAQRIEGGTARVCGTNRKLSLTFWTYSAYSKTVGVCLIQNYGTGGTADEVIKATVAVPVGVKKHAIVFTTNEVNGKTIAADNYLEIRFGLGYGETAGTTYYGDANYRRWPAAIVGLQEFRIGQVKLEEGDSPTPFIFKSYGEDLILCQRYFRKFNTEGVNYTGIAIGQAFAATGGRAVAMISPPMYKIPTPAQKSNLAVTKLDGSHQAVTVITVDANISSLTQIWFAITTAAGLTAGEAFTLRSDNSATGDLWLDAEV